MASSFKQNMRTYVAGGTIAAYSFVKLDTTAPATTKNPRVVVCESGQSHGISQNASQVTIGQEVEVALPGGGALLTAGGAITIGNTIKPATAGAGVVCASAGDAVGARAFEGAASGDIIGVHVMQFEKYNSTAN